MKNSVFSLLTLCISLFTFGDSTHLVVAQELPDVVFDLTPLPIPPGAQNVTLQGMNEQLQAVGVWRDNDTSITTAYLYDHTAGNSFSLDDLISETDRQQLVTQGWVKSAFRAINDWGLVVGYVKNADESVVKGFTLDLRTVPATLDFDGVPNFGSSDVVLRAVNNNADIVGFYSDTSGESRVFVYNPGLAENGFNLPDPFEPRDLGPFVRGDNVLNNRHRLACFIRFSADGIAQRYLYDVENNTGPTLFSNPTVSGSYYEMDSFARTCGNVKISINKRKSNYFPVVWDSDGTILWQGPNRDGTGAAAQLNEPSIDDLINGITLGDVLFRKGYYSDFDYWLYSPAWGELNIDELIDPTDPYLPAWLLNGLGDPGSVCMTEKRPGTNFGAIAGSSNGGGWILVPRPIGPTPGITVTPTNGLVTTEGGGTDSFTVVLDTAPTEDVTVNVSSSETAEGMISSSATLTFSMATWHEAQTVTIIGVDDSATDGDFDYEITATATGGDYEGLTAEVTVTNLDNEVSNVTMSVDDPSVIEGDRKDKARGEYTITLSEASTSDVQVWYQVSKGSAGNKDYRMVDSASGWLTFAAGDTSETVWFDVLGDTRRESNETFTIELTDVVGATISKSVGTATIIDND